MPEPTAIPQTIEQQRACFALAEVKKITGDGEPGSPHASYVSEFKSYANALPAMIHTNGFGQAMAFCRSKSNSKDDQQTDKKAKAYEALFKIVETWLTKEEQPYAGSTDLLTAITGKDMHTYRLAQAEAIALLIWVKKFANAFAKKEMKTEESSPT